VNHSIFKKDDTPLNTKRIYESLYTRLNSQVGKRLEQELVWEIYERLDEPSWTFHNKLRFQMDRILREKS